MTTYTGVRIMQVEVRRRGARRGLPQGVAILDVTSRGPEPWVRFSPFYPHGGIPIPLSPNVSAMSVEGIWQALKVFERQDVDLSKLYVARMRGLKRSARVHGRVLGHRAGVDSEVLLDYEEARRAIYLPAYRWVLEHRLITLLAELRELAVRQPVVLWDFETNGDVADLRRPLSHATLVRAHLLGEWPEERIFEQDRSQDPEQLPLSFDLEGGATSPN